MGEMKELVPTDNQLKLIARKIANKIPERDSFKEKTRQYDVMSPINWRTIEAKLDMAVLLTDKLEKAQQAGQRSNAMQHNKDLIRELRQYQEELVVFTSGLEMRNMDLAGQVSADEIFIDLKNLRDLNGVPFTSCRFLREVGNADNTQVIVRTEPITLTYHGGRDVMEMGEYEIMVDFNRYHEFRPIMVTALDPTNTTKDHGHVHPHVASDGTFCENDHGTDIDLALDTGRIVDALSMWLAILRVYNEGAAFVELESWDGTDDEDYIDCEDCGESTFIDEVYTCQDCEDTKLCGGCATSCVDCSDTTCCHCRQTCKECTEYLCVGCVRKCDRCAAVICSECYSTTEKTLNEYPNTKKYLEEDWDLLCTRCKTELVEKAEDEEDPAEDEIDTEDEPEAEEVPVGTTGNIQLTPSYTPNEFVAMYASGLASLVKDEHGQDPSRAESREATGDTAEPEIKVLECVPASQEELHELAALRAGLTG